MTAFVLTLAFLALATVEAHRTMVETREEIYADVAR